MVSMSTTWGAHRGMRRRGRCTCAGRHDYTWISANPDKARFLRISQPRPPAPTTRTFRSPDSVARFYAHATPESSHNAAAVIRRGDHLPTRTECYSTGRSDEAALADPRLPTYLAASAPMTSSGQFAVTPSAPATRPRQRRPPRTSLARLPTPAPCKPRLSRSGSSPTATARAVARHGATPLTNQCRRQHSGRVQFAHRRQVLHIGAAAPSNGTH